MGFFETHLLRYSKADEADRTASKAHWLQVYADNVNSGADCSVSARVLANMALVDSGKYKVSVE